MARNVYVADGIETYLVVKLFQKFTKTILFCTKEFTVN